MIKIIENIFRVIVRRLISQIKFIIIDFDYNEGSVVFLCYGGKAFFKKKLLNAVVDDKLISGLHPEQACFLGMMTSRWLKENKDLNNVENHQNILRRYNYNSAVEDSIAFDRKGNLIYMDNQAGELKIEKTHIVAASRELISKFHPIVACSIGISVGSNLRRLKSFEAPDTLENVLSNKNNIIVFPEVKLKI